MFHRILSTTGQSKKAKVFHLVFNVAVNNRFNRKEETTIVHESWLSQTMSNMIKWANYSIKQDGLVNLRQVPLYLSVDNSSSSTATGVPGSCFGECIFWGTWTMNKKNACHIGMASWSWVLSQVDGLNWLKELRNIWSEIWPSWRSEDGWIYWRDWPPTRYHWAFSKWSKTTYDCFGNGYLFL